MKDHTEFYKQIGQSIRLRRGKSLPQESLAFAVGLTRTSISNIESGRQKMLLHTFIDIADALKTDAASLLPGRPTVTSSAVDADKVAALPENERAFIESAIGIKTRQEKNANGCQEKKIRELVQTLLTEAKVVAAPVPVWEIARVKGARIVPDSLDGDLSGFLYRDASQKVIGVNTQHAPVRQNLTVAHELAHLLLHDQEQLHVDRAYPTVRLSLTFAVGRSFAQNLGRWHR